jgi:AraC family transcriptional regulator of arabinose operon
MIEVYKSTTPFRSITLSIETIQLLLLIFKESTEEYKLTKGHNTVKKIIEFLERKESFSFNSKELELYLGMNYSYLCEVFKSKTGYTLHMFNSQLFIYKAVNLMRTSNMNISQISAQLGFNNPFYFNKVLRRVMDCSPSEYLSRIYLCD